MLLCLTEHTREVTQRLRKGKHVTAEGFTACDHFSTHMSRSQPADDCVDKAAALGDKIVTGCIRGQQPVIRAQLGQTISDHKQMESHWKYAFQNLILM